MIRTAINAVPLRGALTGVGHYTLNLMRAIEETGRVSARYFYGSHWAEHIVPKASVTIDNVKAAVKKVVPYPYVISRLGQKVVFASGVMKHKPQLYHEPNYIALPFRGPLMTTVYDLSFKHYAHTHPAERIADFTANLPKTLKRAQHVLTISEFVKQEIIEHLGVPESRITVAPPGVGHEFHQRNAEQTKRVMQHHQLAHGQYLLSVGTLEPRKNLAQAITAYAQLPKDVRTHFPFIVAGKAGWREEGWVTSQLKQTMQSLESAGQLRFLGYVDQLDLPVLYAAAGALVYVSLYEGFGMPIIEAMASGVPVVCSSVGAMLEAAGGEMSKAALLVAPNETDAISAAIEASLTDAARRAQLVAAGLVQAGRFTWEDSAARTVAAYDHMLA
jgi:glycosyltransferase involved in cell wall biosynthesis